MAGGILSLQATRYFDTIRPLFLAVGGAIMREPIRSLSNRSYLPWLTVALFVLMYSSTAFASSLEAQITVASSDCVVVPSPYSPNCYSAMATTDTGPLNLSNSNTFSDSVMQLVWETRVSADYSGLHAFAGEDITLFRPAERQASTQSAAISNDGLHTHGYLLNTGYLLIQSGFFGKFGAGEGSHVAGALSASTRSGSQNCYVNDVESKICEVLIPVSDGLPVSLQLVLNPFVDFRLIGVAGNGFGNSSDFSDTASITSIQTLDSNMRPISGITVTSDSGFAYPVNPASTVPEPSNVYVVGIGVGVLIALRKRG
jgi:hypothetical protein